MLPVLSVNCIVFRFREGHLEYLARRIRGTDSWLVPGSFIRKDEDVYAAAEKLLLNDAGISSGQLSPFGVFGKANRNFQSFLTKEKADIISDPGVVARLLKRSVTFCYYGISGPGEMPLEPGMIYDLVKWILVDDPIELAMDHAEILTAARTKLRAELQSHPVLSGFLPATFTMPELQSLYEAILDRKVDRGNFRRRILRDKFLVEVGDSAEKTGRRPRKLYRFDQERYLNSLTEEVKLGF